MTDYVEKLKDKKKLGRSLLNRRNTQRNCFKMSWTSVLLAAALAGKLTEAPPTPLLPAGTGMYPPAVCACGAPLGSRRLLWYCGWSWLVSGELFKTTASQRSCSSSRSESGPLLVMVEDNGMSVFIGEAESDR